MTTIVTKGRRFKRRDSARTCMVEGIEAVGDDYPWVVHFYYDDAQGSGMTWTLEFNEFNDKWEPIK